MVAAMARSVVKVERYNQEDEGFWGLMGRYFASAKVKRELGVAMSSDETYSWFVAFKDGDLAGFCAMSPEKHGSRLRHVYVLPEHRSNGIATQLVGVAIAGSPKPIALTVRKSEAAFYSRFEFKPNGKTRGQYIDLVKE